MSQRNVMSAPAADMELHVRSGWTDRVGRRLIHHAARRAPDALSERLQEEWLADWVVRSSAMSRLRFAIGCCWATQVIAIQYQPLRLPVSGAAVGEKLVSAYAHDDAGYFSRRSGTLFIVLSLHALLFYGLITTLSHIHGSAPPEPLQNRLLPSPLPHVLPPRIPEPQLNVLKLRVPETQFEFPREPDPDTSVTTEVAPERLIPTIPQLPPQAVKQVLGGPGVGFPNADDFYPPQARRLDEQGVGTVQVCVDAKGRLTSDPNMLQGTGSARLDQAALTLARAGSGHYRATTEDGRPVNSCYAFRVRFQLRS